MRRRPPAPERLLATVLFTDIVGSTELAARLGDRRWREVIARHHAVVRRQLKRFGGRELDTAGDGFFATFERPAPAIHCACAIVDGLQSLGISIRAGIHMGECEVMGGKVGGIAVITGARVMGSGGPGDVLVTSTVRDLVAGSGLQFADRGTHELKGVPGQWHLLEVEWERQAPPAGTALVETIAKAFPGPAGEGERPGRRRTILLPGIVALVLAASAVGVFMIRGGGKVAEILPEPNTVARIDTSTNRFIIDVPVGELPEGVAIGEGSVWVVARDRILYRIDPESGHVINRIGLTGTGIPTGIAVGEGAVWVALGLDAPRQSLLKISPKDYAIDPIAIEGSAVEMVAVGGGAVWAVSSIDNFLSKIDPTTNSVAKRVCLGELGDVCIGHQPVALTFSEGTLWVANALDASVWRIDPNSLGLTEEEIPKIDLKDAPSGLAVGSGRLWVISRMSNSLTVIDAGTKGTIATITLGKGPVGVAVDVDAVWIAEASGQEVVRIDPRTTDFSGRIPVPAGPDQIAVGMGMVWVTIHAP
jgi:YVTN family beta-propeller protein